MIVPCLTTALQGPLQQLEKHLLQNEAAIETWLQDQWVITPPSFYTSVDLRNEGFKLAPVDTNLFPAGFNNLNPDFLPLCVQASQTIVKLIYPSARNILIIPENHTRNILYLENIASLCDILSKAGFSVRIGSLLETITSFKVVNLPSGKQVTLERLLREGNKLKVAEFSPDLILLNNDLSDSIPALLKGVEQMIVPSIHMGWSERLKSVHFSHYKNAAREFSEAFDLDPWLIDPMFRNCGKVNFMAREGEECLVYHAGTLLRSIERKYKKYKVDQEPFVVVKADSGTYGMAVMMVRCVDELRNLNRKQRTRMSSAKGHRAVTQVIIQEGVYSFETLGEAKAVAEPVVYMIGQQVVGGFYRVHTKRSPMENLNAPGMHFEPLAFMNCCDKPRENDERANRFYAYGVVARLAALAAAREIRGKTL